MSLAISNSGPLIHLSKVGLLNHLFMLYDKILILPAVHEEVVIIGKKNGCIDAILVENEIKNANIEIYKNTIHYKHHLMSDNLHQGEIEAIALALQKHEEVILLDDEEARILARKFNLKVRGTLGILIDLVKKNHLTKKEAVGYLTKINDTMYLSSDVYLLVEKTINML